MHVSVTESVRPNTASEIVTYVAGQGALDGGVLAVLFISAIVTVLLSVTLPYFRDALVLGGAFPITV